jgi:hypothetical protein
MAIKTKRSGWKVAEGGAPKPAPSLTEGPSDHIPASIAKNQDDDGPQYVGQVHNFHRILLDLASNAALEGGALLAFGVFEEPGPVFSPTSSDDSRRAQRA